MDCLNKTSITDKKRLTGICSEAVGNCYGTAFEAKAKNLNDGKEPTGHSMLSFKTMSGSLKNPDEIGMSNWYRHTCYNSKLGIATLLTTFLLMKLKHT